MVIEIIGMNCKTCSESGRNVREVVRRMELEAEIIRTDNVVKMERYHVCHVPAVVNDGVLKCIGRVPSERDIRDWLLPYVSSSFSFEV